jgi:sec-independent protein translocase protein TatB
MFDIGWSELVVIAVVALIAIGPKELPGVLRMVGQWMGKARKMASEFQGQFQEAMREAEMADLKKGFDDIKEAATGFTSNNIMTSLQKDVGDALQIGDIDKPAVTTEPVDAQIASAIGDPVEPTTPAAPTPETFVEAETHSAASAAASEPLAITREVAAAPLDIAPAPEVLKDAKAS